MKLGHKLLLAPLLTALVLFGAGQLNAVLTARQATAAQVTMAEQIGIFKKLSASQEQLSQAHADAYRTVALVASLDDAKVKAARAGLVQRMGEIKTELKSLTTDADAELARIAVAAVGLVDAYVKHADSAIDMATVDPNTGIVAMQGADAAYAGMAKTVSQVVARIDENSTAAAAAAAKHAQRLNLGLALAGLLLAGIAVGLAHTMQRRLVGDICLASRAASEVAAGQLMHEVITTRSDEVGDLLRALGAMNLQLRNVVGDVRASASSISQASAEVAQGNMDLSTRTEQQASALEETAASMEQLNATVKQNADNAKQANQLAMGASTVAIKGGEVVGQVVQTMKGINDSSKKIADIISVIDSIAFQTNILALNAAVEAARAGEQGRGFAVVASEVRSLAGRSADAAKEIKALINASVERVAQGTAQVDQAGATMTEVVSSIKRVTDIMGEISAASSEQSAGVSQVGEAITQMDQVTQQNAALVEESAAAAESLKVQALQLVQAVAVFKLSAGEASSPQSAAAPAATPSFPAVNRRGPDRATNVTRPSFGARAKAPTLTAEAAPAAPAKTGTDGDWTSF